MNSVDLTGQRVVVMRDAQSARTAGATEIVVGQGCVITPSARDFFNQHQIAIQRFNVPQRTGDRRRNGPLSGDQIVRNPTFLKVKN